MKTNEEWLEGVRRELANTERWWGLLADTSDRLEESDRQLAEYRNTPTADDSEMQGELELVRDGLAALQKERRDVYKAASQILLLHGCDDTNLTAGMQQLADALTAERAKVAELQHQLETANAANAHRAEESQLEPVGWLCCEASGAYIHHCGEVPPLVRGMYASDGHAMSYAKGLQESVARGQHRRVFLGPAEPLEVTP